MPIIKKPVDVYDDDGVHKHIEYHLFDTDKGKFISGEYDYGYGNDRDMLSSYNIKTMAREYFAKRYPTNPKYVKSDDYWARHNAKAQKAIDELNLYVYTGDRPKSTGGRLAANYLDAKFPKAAGWVIQPGEYITEAVANVNGETVTEEGRVALKAVNKVTGEVQLIDLDTTVARKARDTTYLARLQQMYVNTHPEEKVTGTWRLSTSLSATQPWLSGDGATQARLDNVYGNGVLKKNVVNLDREQLKKVHLDDTNRFFKRATPNDLLFGVHTQIDAETDNFGNVISVSAKKFGFKQDTGELVLVDVLEKYYYGDPKGLGAGGAQETHGYDLKQIGKLQRLAGQKTGTKFDDRARAELTKFVGNTMLVGHNIDGSDGDIKWLFGMGADAMRANGVIDTFQIARAYRQQGVNSAETLFAAIYDKTSTEYGLRHHWAGSDTTQQELILAGMIKANNSIGKAVRTLLLSPGWRLAPADYMGSNGSYNIGFLEEPYEDVRTGRRATLNDLAQSTDSSLAGWKLPKAFTDIQGKMETIDPDMVNDETIQMIQRHSLSTNTEYLVPVQGGNTMATGPIELEQFSQVVAALQATTKQMAGAIGAVANVATEMTSLRMGSQRASADKLMGPLAAHHVAPGEASKWLIDNDYLQSSAAADYVQQQYAKELAGERGPVWDRYQRQGIKVSNSSVTGSDDTHGIPVGWSAKFARTRNEVWDAIHSVPEDVRNSDPFYANLNVPSLIKATATIGGLGGYRTIRGRMSAMEQLSELTSLSKAVAAHTAELNAPDGRLTLRDKVAQYEADKATLHTKLKDPVFAFTHSMSEYDSQHGTGARDNGSGATLEFKAAVDAFAKGTEQFTKGIEGVFGYKTGATLEQGAKANEAINTSGKRVFGRFWNPFERASNVIGDDITRAQYEIERKSALATGIGGTLTTLGNSVGGLAGGALSGVGHLTSTVGTWAATGETPWAQRSKRNMLSGIQHEVTHNFDLLGAVLAPLEMAANVFKRIPGIALKMFGYFKQGMGYLQNLGNPLTGLTGVNYEGYQRTTAADRMVGLSRGSTNATYEGFASAQGGLYTLGQLDTNRLVSAALLGNFGEVYANGGDTEAQYGKVVEDTAAKVAQGGMTARNALTWAGNIDKELAGKAQMLARMREYTGNANLSYRDMNSPETFGGYYYGLKDSQMGQMYAARNTWGGATESLQNILMKSAVGIWDNWGKKMSAGIMKQLDGIADSLLAGDMGGAWDKVKSMLSDGWEKVKEVLDEGGIGDKIKASVAGIWNAIAPVIGEIAQKIVPVIASIGSAIYDTFYSAMQAIIKASGELWSKLSDVQLDPYALLPESVRPEGHDHFITSKSASEFAHSGENGQYMDNLLTIQNIGSRGEVLGTMYAADAKDKYRRKDLGWATDASHRLALNESDPVVQGIQAKLGLVGGGINVDAYNRYYGRKGNAGAYSDVMSRAAEMLARADSAGDWAASMKHVLSSNELGLSRSEQEAMKKVLGEVFGVDIDEAAKTANSGLVASLSNGVGEFGNMSKDIFTELTKAMTEALQKWQMQIGVTVRAEDGRIETETTVNGVSTGSAEASRGRASVHNLSFTNAFGATTAMLSNYAGAV